MGKDIMSLMSVPVFIMARLAQLGQLLRWRLPSHRSRQEPTSVLQKMAEIMEYSELLDKAALCEARALHRRVCILPLTHVQDPQLRLLYVACFAVGAYPSAERTYKPFNPILGETFELQRGEMRYIAEQVCPPPRWATAAARRC
jgi:hypothetical protein